jgi:hypothetical protein
MKTSYSRRELYEFGEPLGDSVTRKEGSRVIYGGGGSGGGGGTSTQVVDLPEWAKPTAQKQLALTESVTDINKNPFQSFGGVKDASGKQVGFDASKVVAGMDPLQQQAYQGAGNLQTSPQLGMASGLMGVAAQRALNTGYRPGQFQNQFQAPDQYQSGQFDADRVQAQNLQNFQMGPAERVGTQSFRQPGAAEAYMDPYMQNVVNIQQREAQRAADIAGTQRGAQAVGAGAFGGSRQAIMDAEAARNLSQQKGDIQARGLQSAFQNAQQQFNAEQGYGLQAQQANQQAGLTTGQQNLAALLGIQQLGAGQNLQAQLANQQQAIEAQRLAEQSRQFGAGQGMTAAQAAAQYGQSAQQLAEQSRQFGGSLGIQGLQTAMTGAGQLGALGGQQFGQQKDILGLQNQFGGQQQAQQQALINAEAQNFAAQQRYPYQQLEFMSNILRGTPMGTVQSMYQAPPNPLSQVVGAGTALYGASKMAKGGSVSDAKVKREKKKSAGLAELALSKI